MEKSKTGRFKLNTTGIGTIILVSVYLLFSIGILKATHFCMGREASVAFFTTETEKCACSLFAGEKDGCCDDEKDLLKLETEQKSISTLTLSLPQWMVIEKLYTEQLVASHDPALEKGHPSKDPLPTPIPLFKFYCSYVFYDEGLIA